MMTYWNNRGISTDVLEAMGVSYEEKGDWKWFVFPVMDKDGKTLFRKLKKHPDGPKEQPRAMYDPKGSTATLWPLPYMSPNNSGSLRVWLAEGESDTLTLLSLGENAVTSTSGAGTFRPDWLEHFPERCTVIGCYDNDEAGESGWKKVEEIFTNRPDITLRRVRIPGGNKDINEYICSGGTLEKLLMDRETIQSPSTGKARPIVDIGTTSSPLSYDKWKREIKENFPELWNATKICCSVLTQLLIPDVHNPFCLILVDSPSSGKTITLNFFRDIKNLAVFCDDFTPASFVTGIAGRTEEQLKKIDLLPRIQHKSLIVPEMASVLSANEDELRKRMGILTRVLDGEGYTNNTGVHGSRGYLGDYLFVFLGASTPFPLRVWKAMTGYGHRMFFLNLGTSDPTIDQLVAQLSGYGYKWSESRCRTATESFLQGIWKKTEWNKEADSPEAQRIISKYAVFQASYRGDIIVYDERDETGRVLSHTKPEIEKPHRANQQLYNLCRGHAILHGRNHITKEDTEILPSVVFSTAPSPRPDILRLLIKQKGALLASDIMEELHMVRSSAKKEMTKLASLGICELDKGDKTTEDPWESDSDNKCTWSLHIADRFRWIVYAI